MFISAAAPVEGGRVGNQWAAGAAARLRPRLGAFGKRGPDYPEGRALAAPAPPWAASPTQSRVTRGGPIQTRQLRAPTPRATKPCMHAGVSGPRQPRSTRVVRIPAYVFDFGFTGGWQRYGSRYALRSELFASGGVVERLRNESGMRFFIPGKSAGFLPHPKYVRVLSSSKVWLATTEGSGLGPRFFEVLASGRAMLLCNRHPVAYAPLGIVEGTHAAMFNTTGEFEAVLRYYLRHENERLSIVRAARRLALRRHTWHTRTREFVRELPHAACGVQRNFSM